MIIEMHSREAYVLQRRLELLTILNDLLLEDLRSGGPPRDLDDPEIEHISSQFSDVLTPADVCSSIRKIYPFRVFGPRK